MRLPHISEQANREYLLNDTQHPIWVDGVGGCATNGKVYLSFYCYYFNKLKSRPEIRPGNLNDFL